MNLEYMKVSNFEIYYGRKWTFTQYSNSKQFHWSVQKTFKCAKFKCLSCRTEVRTEWSCPCSFCFRSGFASPCWTPSLSWHCCEVCRALPSSVLPEFWDCPSFQSYPRTDLFLLPVVDRPGTATGRPQTLPSAHPPATPVGERGLLVVQLK